tara:strand:+ start:156 stop:626 length:471 start_codon:yes stop_codon:yes gene_type:complete
MEWIKGYEGLYKINREGEIWSSKTNIIIKQWKRKDGYWQPKLWKEGKCYPLKLHRLLAIQYIPNLENKPVIDHINRIKDDNRLENLRWATSLENNNNTKDYNTNSSGYRCIRVNPSGSIRVRVTYNNITKDKSHKTLEEAIAWREETIVSMKAGTS